MHSSTCFFIKTESYLVSKISRAEYRYVLIVFRLYQIVVYIRM